MKVLIAGATGLVGNYLLDYLISNDNVSQIHVLSRRHFDAESHKLVLHIIEFDSITGDEAFFNVDTVFCCLGTTIKKAGSKQAFEKVDFGYPIKLATYARKAGATCFSIITAIGADSESNFFYNRVKGRVEEEVRKLHFNRLHIHRPAGIKGERKESRPGESFFNSVLGGLSFILVGSLRLIRPVEANNIARVMLKKVLESEPGEQIVISTEYQNTY